MRDRRPARFTEPWTCPGPSLWARSPTPTEGKKQFPQTCRKRLDLSIPTLKSGSFLGLVENDTGRGVFFTKLAGRLLPEVAVNKNHAEHNQYSARLPEVSSWTLAPNPAPVLSHPWRRHRTQQAPMVRRLRSISS